MVELFFSVIIFFSVINDTLRSIPDWMINICQFEVDVNFRTYMKRTQ